jgi:hypothetical protein
MKLLESERLSAEAVNIAKCEYTGNEDLAPHLKHWSKLAAYRMAFPLVERKWLRIKANWRTASLRRM